MSLEKEKYRLHVTIKIAASELEGIEEALVEDVLCKVFLTNKKVDRPSLHFLPTRDQEKKLQAPALFSMHGERPEPNGDLVRISSDQIHITSHKGTTWGPDMVEYVLIGEPWDLKIEHIRPEDTTRSEPRTQVFFWLSPIKLLSPISSVMKSYTGEVKTERLDLLRIPLDEGIEITFDRHSRYWDLLEGGTVMYGESVAVLDLEEDIRGTTKITEAVDHLDDLLRIVSFVGEYRCVCVGWQAADSSTITQVYRGRFVLTNAEPPSMHDALVDYAHFEDFTRTAYLRLKQITPNAALRRALDYLVPDENDTLESSYIMLYASLETIVLFFRREESLEFIFSDPAEWDHLRRDMQQWLKSHPTLSGDRAKRALVYEKLPELMRMSFSSAFKQFCRQYSVDLSDLWPVVGNSGGVSLSSIRNMLVHGEVFEQRHFGSLMGAREHLRWSVYRMVFAMLGWPVDRTKINPERVRHSLIHRTWERDRQILSS